MPEAFHARFPVSVKSSPLVSSAFFRRRIGLRPPKLLVAREKKTSGTQGILHWADPGCFHRGVVSTRVQGKRPRAKGMVEGVMFEYVDFLHFNFTGINLRHYY